MYNVVIKKRVLKTLRKLPVKIQKKFSWLIDDLRDKIPIQEKWPNYNKIGKTDYHYHLDYSWVACWSHEKDTIEIEVYYAGSRENAPY